MLVQRGKTYYSRVWVPCDLRGQFGCKELVQSLHTKDKRSAKAAAKVLEGETETLFQVVRSGMIDENQINNMIERHRLRTLDNYTEARRQHGPKVYLPPSLQEVPVEQLIETVVKYHVTRQKKLEACVQLNQYDEVQETADSLLSEFELKEPKDSADYSLLCEYLLKSEHLISNEIIKRMSGGSIAPKIAVPAAKLSDLFAYYQEDRLTRKKWNERTKEKYTQYLQDYVKILGDKPLTAYRADHALKLLTDLQKAGNSSNTASEKVGFLSSLFNFGIQKAGNDERWRVAGNPFADSRIEKTPAESEEDKKIPYTQEDLLKLLEGLLTVRKRVQPHRFWIPLIALYTGMRQGEITQLRVADIEAVNSTLAVIHVRHRPDLKQKVKNKRDRTIPLHPELKRLGLLQYVEEVRKTKHDRLFPLLTWTAGKDWSGKVRGWWNEQHQEKFIADTENKSFHSLRKSFLNQFKQSRVYTKVSDRQIVQSMVGHEGMDDVTAEHYEGKFPPETQYRILCKLNYGFPPELLKKLRDKEY